ncbi:MAG: proton-conducting transporter membrane subunit [Pyrodictiaceae archaeon]
MVLSVAEALVLSIIASLSVAGLVAPLGPRSSKAIVLAMLAYSFAATLVLTVFTSRPIGLFGGVLVLDKFSLLITAGLTLAILLDAIGSYRVTEGWSAVEALYAVSALIVLGVYAIGFSLNLVTAYAAWILAAAASYIIVALRKDWVSAEAATKYAMLGGLSSTLLVLAIGYLYSATGSISIVSRASYADPLLVAALSVLLITSIGYKMGVVPFQGWLPDVYGNARPLLVAIVAPASKALATLLLIRLVSPIVTSPNTSYNLVYFVLASLLAIVTMTYGNVAAVVARNPQLLLAYSSIAQAGYLVVGLAALANLPGLNREYAMMGLALHTLGYMFSKAAGFLALDAALDKVGSEWSDIGGFWFRDKPAALGLALALMSLMGIPPFLGFWGKLYLVLAIVAYAPVVAIIMAINFAIAAFYYAKLIYTLFAPATPREEIAPDLRSYTALTLSLITLILGLVPWIASGLNIAGLY